MRSYRRRVGPSSIITGVLIKGGNLDRQACRENARWKLEGCCHKSRSYQKLERDLEQNLSSEGVSPDDTRSQTSRLQNCKATNFSSLNGPLASLCYGPPGKLIQVVIATRKWSVLIKLYTKYQPIILLIVFLFIGINPHSIFSHYVVMIWI